MKSASTHLQMVESNDDLTSRFEIECKTQERRSCHTLISVQANGNSYSMDKIDISIVIAIFDCNMKTPTI